MKKLQNPHTRFGKLAVTSAGNIIAAGGYVPLSALSNSISLATLGGVLPASAFSNGSIPQSALSNVTLATLGGVLPASAFSNGSIPASAFSGASFSTATFSNLTVTNSLTLGTNTIGFTTGSANQITAQTWNYMQNYVYTGTGLSNSLPITRGLMTGVASLHSAYVESGNVYVFGNNANGQLGLGSTSNAALPTKVPSINGTASNVACGQNFTVVQMIDGSVTAGQKDMRKNGTLRK